MAPVAATPVVEATAPSAKPASAAVPARVAGAVHPAPAGPQTYKRAGTEQPESVTQQITALKTNDVPASPAAAEPAPAEPGSAPVQPAVREIPVGTEIAVRTVETVASESADLTKRYGAALDDALTINGVVIAPKGSRATLRVVETKKAGRFGGRATLALRLASITVDNQEVAIATSEAVSESGSQGARTGKGAAVGAAVGAAIGGLLGGGSGAVKGAAAGAATGVVAVALTGPKVTVPAETRLIFKLSEVAVVAP